MLPTIASTVHRVDPSLATTDPATMGQVVDDSPSAYLHRASASLAGIFGGLAFLLSVVGLYGVISYSVSRRTREIGLRMALGAARGSVYNMVMREFARLTSTGIAVGLICSIAGATLMRKLLFGTQVWDIPTLVGVALLLAVFALLTTYLPARRTASVNPIDALRAE